MLVQKKKVAQKKNVRYVCKRCNMLFFSHPDVIEHKAMTDTGNTKKASASSEISARAKNQHY
ncbi:hypothetical protein Ngar_c14810 [Candidatus Nitrososphaera gargensis Ga9.2]|uniref:Uncharacterized protein n=1 Tax=Nitrososphaera gargensis (strain Ga9.2) TaxID=1237085 RepID=K0IJH1_NITGG|nr:hypothetical protein Ngar_c14810 [Candidatus Nitrososphaera gargensis Ga9.2]